MAEVGGRSAGALCRDSLKIRTIGTIETNNVTQQLTEHIRKPMAQLNEWTALLLFATLPFYYSRFTQFALILFFATWVFDLLLNQRWQAIQWRSNEQKWTIAIWGALVVYYLLDVAYYPIESDRIFWSMIVGEQRLSYWGFAIVGIIGIQRQYSSKSFLIVGLLMVYASLLTVLFHYVGWDMLMAPGGWDYLIHERHVHIAPHMVYNLYCNSVLLLIFYQMQQESSHTKRIGWLLAGLPIYLLICNSDGRIGMIGAQVVVLAGVCRLWHAKKRYFFGALALLTAIAIPLIATHPKFDRQAMASSESNPRLIIWRIGMEGLSEQPFYGRGSSSAAVYMRDRMLAQEESFAVDPNIAIALREQQNICTHPHNTLLQAGLEHGIFGIALMLIVLLGPFALTLRARTPMLATAFWMCVNLQLLTEPIHSAFSEVTFCTYLLFLLHVCRTLARSKVEGHPSTGSGTRSIVKGQ